MRPGSLLASAASIQAGGVGVESAAEYLAEVADVSGGRGQFGAAGQNVFQAGVVLLRQGGGMTGEPAGHLPHRRRPGRRLGRSRTQGGDVGADHAVGDGSVLGNQFTVQSGDAGAPRGEASLAAAVATHESDVLDEVTERRLLTRNLRTVNALTDPTVLEPVIAGDRRCDRGLKGAGTVSPVGRLSMGEWGCRMDRREGAPQAVSRKG